MKRNSGQESSSGRKQGRSSGSGGDVPGEVEPPTQPYFAQKPSGVEANIPQNVLDELAGFGTQLDAFRKLILERQAAFESEMQLRQTAFDG